MVTGGGVFILVIGILVMARVILKYCQRDVDEHYQGDSKTLWHIYITRRALCILPRLVDHGCRVRCEVALTTQVIKRGSHYDTEDKQGVIGSNAQLAIS